VAFQFCKVATVAVLAGRYVLPLAAGLASILFVSAYAKGKRDTRCIGKHPLLIAAFWAVVCGLAIWRIVVGSGWWWWF
jgi:hypothetical protein